MGIRRIYRRRTKDEYAKIATLWPADPVLKKWTF